MDILVIGNGFDLAHDLKTSYKDFLEHCSKKNVEDFTDRVPLYRRCCKTNLWMKHFIAKQKQLGDTWIDLENEIYSIIAFLKEIPGIKGGGETKYICPQLLSIPKDNNNFNFYDIKNYLNSSDNDPQVDTKEYMTEITEGMFYAYIKTPKGFINFLYDQLREFTKGFEDYLTEKVLKELLDKSKYQLSLQAIGVQPQDKDVHVLSFNYTNTCEKLYKQKFNTYCNLRIKPVYVHGKVCNSETCDLIMGTYSFSNERTSSNTSPIPVDFNVFKKHNQRHRYGTIEAYQDFLKILTDPKRIIKPVFHVIGHSLDKTDHNILKHVFLINKNSIINIYYHNEEAQERLINNITEIIGEEEVMTKVRMIYQHDKKRGILIPKE